MMIEKDLARKVKNYFGHAFPRAVQKNRRLIGIVAILFLAVAGLAAAGNQAGENTISRDIREFTKPFREEMSEEVKVERSPLGWIGLYWKRNLVSSLAVVGLGTIFGIFSLYSLVVNGLLVGFVATEANMSAMGLFSVLLPHGVFELTGYIILVTCGIRLGMGSIKGAYNREAEPLKEAGEKIGFLLPGALLFIVVAGIIEALISPFMGPILNPLKITASLVTFTMIILWMSGRLTMSVDR